MDSVKDQEVSVGISRGQQGVPVIYDGVVAESGLDPVGEITLQGDMSTLTPLPYAPSHFRVMGDMLQEGKVWGNCPRGFLKKMNTVLEEKGLKVKASFENEFYLLKPGHPLNDRISKNTQPSYQPGDGTPFASTHSMDLNHSVIMNIVESLIAQNITVEQYYPESGPGQHEITMRYSDALSAAGNQVIFRETVKATAYQHGLIASFLPKIFPDTAGSGCHLHLSLWKDDENILQDPDTEYGIGETAQAFIAGILYHLPALMAITTPIPRSYRRIRPHLWSGAFQIWGFNNREAAVRVIQEENGKIRHLELKTVDATSNPYLVLGAVIAAGLHGIQENMRLAEPVQRDPATLSPEERNENRIIPLPGNLGEALAALGNDETILYAMGPDLSQSYLAVKNKEYEYLQAIHSQKEVELLLEKY